MTGLEYENFCKADDRRYILKENNEFMDWYLNMKKQGFSSIIDINQMQNLINNIVMFYEFKYPSEMFDSLRYSTDVEENQNTIKIAGMLSFDQLKFRLYHDYIQFLDCNYWNYVSLKRPRKNLWDLTSMSIRIYPDGKIEPVDLDGLKENKFLDDISGINSIENLYGKFESIDTNVDYSELTRCIRTHKFNVTLRNKILSLVPFALLYSSNTLPQNGYIRAKSFIRTFNREYNLNMDLDELDEIMSRDYTGKQKVKSLNNYK